MLELSTTFRGISTATNTDAAGTAKANLRYITRDSAASVVIAKLDAHTTTAARTPTEKKAVLREMGQHIEERAGQGGKNGKRVAEKLMFSLPNEWSGKLLQDALRNVANTIAPKGSEVRYVLALHTDKENNKHVHVLALDGAESHEAAKARRPDAKRVRRQNVIRLSESGGERPKQLRREIAAALNTAAAQHGVEGVEWRSFEDRGITDREPGRHRGPDKPRLKEHHRAAVRAAEIAEAERLARRERAVRRAAERHHKEHTKPVPEQKNRSKRTDIQR